MSESKHFYKFEEFSPKSRWIFVTPSNLAKSLGLYVIELGHFFQAGHCYTKRVPENSFIISFPAPNQPILKKPYILTYEGKIYYSYNESGNLVSFLDNRSGYIQEQDCEAESYFISFGGFLAEKYYNLFRERNSSIFSEVSWIPAIINSFEELAQFYCRPTSDMHDLYASMLLNQLLTHLVMNTDNHQSLHIRNSYVIRTMEIIKQRFNENLKLQDIAHELHINPSYLSRLISKETGTSFSSCLTHIRINHAKGLLHTTNASIEEIGAQCGFCNASHFIKFFRRYENISPFQYRSIQQKGMNTLKFV